MGKKILSFLKYFIFLGGGLFLVWWQLHNMSGAQMEEFKHALRSADYILIIPVILMNLLSHLSRSMRWKLLMEPLGYSPKLKNVFAVTMVGYLANGAVNRLGEVLKCTFLARYEGLKSDRLIGTILIERAFDLICYIIFITITVLIQLDVLGAYTVNKLRNLAHGGDIPLWGKVLLLVAIIASVVFVARKIFRSFPNNKAVVKIRDFFSGIGKGFASIKNLTNRRAFLLHTLFIWAMYLLQIYLAFKAMDATAHLGLKAACSVLSLSTLAMIITPGGIGSFPIFVQTTLALYLVNDSDGFALGWLIWGVSTGIIVVAGVVALLLLPYINKKRNEVITGNNGEDLYLN